MKVRDATQLDVEAIAEIHVQAYEEAYRGLVPDEVIDRRDIGLRRRVWSERVDHPDPRAFVLVAELDGRVAGFISARPATSDESENGNGHVGCLENLYLGADVIGTPSGSLVALELHRLTLNGLQELDFTEAVAFVTEGNLRSRRLFEGLGWRPDGGYRHAEGVLQHRLRRRPQVERTASSVEREYGTEKWPAMLARIEAEIAAEPDGGLARILGRVARSQWSGSDVAFDRVRFILDGRSCRIPLGGAYGATQGVMLEAISEVMRPETDLVVELGSGWGWHLLSLWIRGGPRHATYVAAEYTQAGRDASARLAGLDERLRFRAVPFDYHQPQIDLGPARHAVVFTSHSIEQIPYVNPALFDCIRSLAPRVDCLHFEPVGWQIDGLDRRMSSRSYAEAHDYTRDFMPVLREQATAGRLVIDGCDEDVFGINTKNATTVVRWHHASA